MKLFVIALILVGLSAAFTVKPDYFGIQDTGSASKPLLGVDIIIDCDTKDVIVGVSSGQPPAPLSGASTTLFYTDYGYQPLPNRGTTGEDGMARMAVPGTLDFLTGLFILRVDHPNFQSREIEFAYEKCFEPQPEEFEEEPVPEEPEEIVQPEEEAPEPEEPEINETVPNITEPVTIEEPIEEPVVAKEKPAPSCPLGILVLSLLLFKAKL